ncbi:unnamed protein product [Spirodela intermedia]|uniref:Uncharacterized protein n=1 Tax=Spirodela intermedia TaxID=51605 RepID=A0A7I8K2P5_SPIIN|nr:unnamed protein product [Spirodela intermedia]
MSLLFTVLFLLLAGSSISPAAAEIRFSNHQSESGSITPIDEFAFEINGELELNVSWFVSPRSIESEELVHLGFFLTTRDAWFRVLQENQDSNGTCPLHSDLIETVFTFDLIRQPSHEKIDSPFGVVYKVKKPGQYTLVFANCVKRQLEVSMDIRSAMYNKDPDTGARDYLSSGTTVLPRFYFLLFLVYAPLAGLWIYLLYKKRLTAFRIHYFMLALVVLKAINLLCEAEDMSYIRRTGSAHGWDVLFYIFSFLKGITLFTLIVLIGTGWSFLKPFLQDKEKKVLMVVIPLQVIANIALVVLDENPFATSGSISWKQIWLLVDVICCCAVLFPIVWSIKKLREAARTDGKAAVNLMKLTLFRQYYIVVICYIYFTRIGVYALAIITSYRYQWTSEVAKELATLAFFVFTGYKFRPEAHNPYFVIDDEEEEAAAEALKVDDEFEL